MQLPKPKIRFGKIIQSISNFTASELFKLFANPQILCHGSNPFLAQTGRIRMGPTVACKVDEGQLTSAMGEKMCPCTSWSFRSSPHTFTCLCCISNVNCFGTHFAQACDPKLSTITCANFLMMMMIMDLSPNGLIHPASVVINDWSWWTTITPWLVRNFSCSPLKVLFTSLNITAVTIHMEMYVYPSFNTKFTFNK